MVKLDSIFKGKCPNCNESKGLIFSKRSLTSFPKMNSHCPNCNVKFEKEPGFFFGAMFVSYALAVLEGIIAFLLLFPFTSNINIWLVAISLTIVLCSGFNFKYSRIIWIYIFPPKTS